MVESTGKIESWPLAKLKPWEANPRFISKDNYARLKASIRDKGLRGVMSISEDGTVCNGVHRLRAVLELSEAGETSIKEVKAEVFKAPGEQEKLELALEGNDEYAQWDEAKTMELSSQLGINLELQAIHLQPAQRMDMVMKNYAPDGGDRDIDQNTLKDQLDTYMAGNITQIVLYFSKEEYNATIPRLDKVLHAESLENNTEAFLAMLKFYEEGHSA